MSRLTKVLVATLLALGWTACGAPGEGGDVKFADRMAAEVSETPTLTLLGRVLDDTGAPVFKAMMVLCGNVDGLEVCLQRFTEDDGTFRYDDLRQGYTHLQVMPYAATAESGTRYAGVSFTTALPTPPAIHEWGDVVLPVIAETATLVVVDGGLLSLGPMTLEVEPGSASFPGLEAEGPVGAVRVGSDLIPEQFEGSVGFAFYPFDTRLSTAAQVRIPLASLTDVWEGTGPVDVMVNSTDHGGLYAVPVVQEEAEIVFEITELTWIVLTFK